MDSKEAYYYCSKCNAIPLVHLMANGEDLKVYTVCKCEKKLLSYEAFNKSFYQENKKENLSQIKENLEAKENISI